MHQAPDASSTLLQAELEALSTTVRTLVQTPDCECLPDDMEPDLLRLIAKVLEPQLQEVRLVDILPAVRTWCWTWV